METQGLFREAALFRSSEAVHSGLPLETDDRALGWLQQSQRAEQGERQPYSELKPRQWCVSHFNGEDRRYDGVTDKDDHEIGRKVVGAMMMKTLAALLAMVGDLQEAPEQRALSAIWAFSQKSAPHCLAQGDPILDGGHPNVP